MYIPVTYPVRVSKRGSSRLSRGAFGSAVQQSDGVAERSSVHMSSGRRFHDTRIRTFQYPIISSISVSRYSSGRVFQRERILSIRVFEFLSIQVSSMQAFNCPIFEHLSVQYSSKQVFQECKNSSIQVVESSSRRDIQAIQVSRIPSSRIEPHRRSIVSVSGEEGRERLRVQQGWRG